MTAPVTTRVAEKASGFLSSRFSRRGFFARSAVVGSAVAVGPVGFALKPSTAYAAVCNCSGSNCTCGSLCCDGYTEFCCTLTGENKCPPGTLMGGWWKADGSGMCNGARYYMDCNAPCNGCSCGGNGVCAGSCSGTGCGCANGDCNNRKAGCTQFRYGQCNQSIPCLGPILCRVITCLAPWDIDPTCTTTVRVDQATLSHDRPCLHRTIGSVDSVVEENGRIRVRGWALDYDTQGPVRIDVYSDNAIIGSGIANTRRDDAGAANPGHGPFHGFDFLVDGRPGNHQICVYAINAAGPGDNVMLGCRQVILGNPVGGFDSLEVGNGTLRVSGWAIDPDTTGPIKIHVYANNIIKGEFTADRSRPDVGAAFPGFGNNHGFDAEFPIQGGLKNVCIYGINQGSGANTQIACRSIEVGKPFGTFDAVSLRPGGIRVRGWGIDPDTTGPILVHAYVDGTYAGAGTANLSRPDVGAAHPGFGDDHGFEFDVNASPGSHQVCIYLLNDQASGTHPMIGCKPVQVLGGNPRGALDNVIAGPGSVIVSGWAFDPDTLGPVRIHVYADGRIIGDGLADVNRPDIAAAFPGYGAAHGFRITLPIPDGFHEVCAYAINEGSGDRNPLVGCRSTFIGGSPYGSVDGVAGIGGGSISVSGWAIDPDTAGPTQVHVYVDGTYRGPLVADVNRPDVGAAFPGYGADHGYSGTFNVGSGSHQVCIYALNVAGAGGNALLACRTVVA